MSYDLNVYLADASSRTVELWSRALAAHGWRLQLPVSAPLTEHSGWLRVTADGQRDAGFELFISAFDPDEFEADAAQDGEAVEPDVLAAIRTTRYVAMFGSAVGRSSDELHIQQLAAALLADVTHGVLGDPQSGQLFVGTNLPFR